MYLNKIILKHTKGKNVLDIGSCGKQGFKFKPLTLFLEIEKVSKTITGVDLESNTPKIIKGNAETIKLKTKFDVITAGDVIEHMDNTGMFISNMATHLNDNGKLIIVTPNVKSPAWIISKGNKDHKLWFCKYTLRKLLFDNGFKVEQIFYGVRRKKYFIRDILRTIFANNMLIIAIKIDKKNSRR